MNSRRTIMAATSNTSLIGGLRLLLLYMQTLNCLQILSLFLITLYSTEASPNCTVNGKDFSLLEKFSPWTVVSDDGNITYKIHLCGHLSGEPADSPASTCNNRASFCMIRGGKAWSIANFNASVAYEQSYASNNESAEFWITRQGESCPDIKGEKLVSIINVKCGKSLGSPEFLEYTMCTSYFEWRTNLACTTPVSDREVKCSVFDKGEKRDLSPLMKTRGAYLVDSTSGWDFYINVCRDITPDGVTLSCPVGSAACHHNNATNKADNFGWPHQQLKINAKGNLELIYSSDTQPSKCTSKPMTTIEFICPDVGGSEDPKLIFQFNCEFRVVWKTEHACPTKAVSSKNSCILRQEDRNIDFDLTPLKTLQGARRYEVYSSPYRYFLNVCDKLGMPCPYDNSSRYASVCQTKVANSDDAHVLGRYDNTLLRYVDGELTLTIRGGQKCHTNFHRTTVISFSCNHTAENYGKGNPKFNREENCTYFFDWDSKYACTEHPADQRCRADYKGHRYDLSPLVRRTGKNWNVLDGGTESKRLRLFYINICNDVIPVDNARRCKSDSSVCLIDETGVHSLGRYSSNPTFDPRTNTLQLIYYNGDSCGEKKQKKSIITLICKPGDLDSSPIFLRQSPDDCIFEFEWHTAAACVLAKTWGSNCQVSDNESGIKFDLNHLKKSTAPFYNVTYGEYDYILNVCGEVTGTKCDGNGRNTPHPGVCKIKHGGAPKDAYNAGQVNTNLTYFDGIIKLTYDKGDVVENSQPSMTRQTQIAFLCDRNAGIGKPSLSPNNVTGVTEFEWKTEFACPNIPVECTAMKNDKQYDLSSLTKGESQGSWTIVDDTDPQHKVKYYLNVCRSLTEVKVGNGCSPFAAACRTHYSVDKEVLDDAYANLGEVTSGPEVQNEGHLSLRYHSVKPLCNDNGIMKNFTTTINFVCKKGDLTNGPARPLKIGNCEFSFLWETEAACPIEDTATSGSNCEIKDKNSDYTFNLAPLRKKGDIDYYEVAGQNGKKFRLNICGGIKNGHCDLAESSNSSVCEVLNNGSKPSITKFNHEELKYSDDGRLTLTYYGEYDTSGNKKEVVILFLCRQNVPFGTPKFSRIVEHTYQFDFETSLVCPPQPVDCMVQDERGTQYDLSPLAKSDTNWAVLDNRQGHMDLKYFINVCRPINTIAGSTCPGGAVGGCQISTHGSAFNLGYIQSKPVVSGNNSLTLVYTNGDICHKGTPREAHRSTRINFFCSTQEHNPSFEGETATCEYIFNWQTPAACPIQRITGDSCRVTDPVYNYQFDFSSLHNKTADYLVPFGEYVYQINVCGPLVKGASECAGKGACQTKSLDKNFNYDAGMATSKLVYDAGEITLTYDNGKPCHENKFKRSTVITFLCDQSASGSKGPTFINETSDCTYQFEWATKLACPPFKVEDCALTNSKGQQFDLTSLALTNDNIEYIDSLKKKKFIFNVCRSLVHKKKETCPFNAAACIVDLGDSNATTRYHNIGEVNDKQVVYDMQLQLHYINGEPCNNGKNKTSTRIILQCDKNAIDTKPAGHFMVGECEHHFLWSTRAACPLGSDIEDSGNCTVKNPQTGYEFDLNSLKLSSSYKLDDKQNHSYWINVCGKVTGTQCTGNNNLAVCQVENVGEKRNFKGGNANSQLQYDDGVVFLNYTGGDKCHGGKFERSTIINFICSESAGKGHPEFIGEDDDCTYQFSWYTSLVCEKQVKCSVDINNTYSIDLSPLIKQTGHHIAISTTTHGVPYGSTFYINVCRPLNPIYGSLCPPGSSACMTTTGQKPQGLGKIHSGPVFDKSTGRITLVYDHGSKCVSDSFKNISTKIIFNCKKGLGQGTPVLEQVTADCQYIFQWDTPVVCRDDDEVSASNDCVYTDKATHAVYNLTELSNHGPYSIKRGSLNYLLNVCGSTGFTNVGCKTSSICRLNSTKSGFGFGRTSNSMFIKTEDVLKLIYTDTKGCGGSKSEGIINFKCDENIFPGSPEIIYPGQCQAVFTWKTRAVCPSVADQCVMSYNGHEYDLRILSNQKSSWQLKDAKGNSYWINICQGIHNSPNTDKCLRMASACRKTKSGQISSLGLVTTQTMHMDNDGKTLVVEYYTNDSVCNVGKTGYKATKTIIKFVCGKTVGGPLFVQSSQNAANCVFEFKWVTSTACQLKEEVVTDKNDLIQDPRSGGYFNLSTVNGQLFTTTDKTYEIDLEGKSTKCPGSVICDVQNKVGYGTVKSITYHAEDDILEAWYTTNKDCERDNSKKVKVILRFQCNEQNEDPIFERESMDCVKVFSWDSQAGCSQAYVVAPHPLPADTTSSQSGGSSSKGKTVATIVSVFLCAILICVLLIIFHKKERREAVVERFRKLISRNGYSTLPQNDLEEGEEDDLLSHITAQDLNLQGTIQTDNDEVNILSRDSGQNVSSYHDDSDEELLA